MAIGRPGDPVEKLIMFGCTVRNISSEYGANKKISRCTVTVIKEEGQSFDLESELIANRGIHSVSTVVLGAFIFTGVVVEWERIVVNVSGKDIYTIKLGDARDVLDRIQIIRLGTIDGDQPLPAEDPNFEHNPEYQTAPLGNVPSTIPGDTGSASNLGSNSINIFYGWLANTRPLKAFIRRWNSGWTNAQKLDAAQVLVNNDQDIHFTKQPLSSLGPVVIGPKTFSLTSNSDDDLKSRTVFPVGIDLEIIIEYMDWVSGRISGFDGLDLSGSIKKPSVGVIDRTSQINKTNYVSPFKIGNGGIIPFFSQTNR